MEPLSGGGSIASRCKRAIMNQYPRERNQRRKKNRGHQVLPMTQLSATGPTSRKYFRYISIAHLFLLVPRFVDSPYGPSQFNGALTTKFSPAALSTTALNLNIPTPEFEGGIFPCHNCVTSQLCLTRPVLVQVYGVVLGLVLPN